VSRRRRNWRRSVTLAVLGLTALAVVLVALAATGRLPAAAERLYPLPYREQIARVSSQYEVDPYLVAAVARAESNFDEQAVSTAGAVGLMHVMPETAQWIAGRPDWQGGEAPDPRDPDDSLQLGTYYLAFLLERFGGDRPAALAAYNAGDAPVRTWLERDSARAGGLTLEAIPYPETRAFVQRVQRFEALYRRTRPGVFAVLAVGLVSTAGTVSAPAGTP